MQVDPVLPSPGPPAGELQRPSPRDTPVFYFNPLSVLLGKEGTGWCRLTVNTREGTGVRSCGWIMERMEGRWPSLDPTKNSLWTEEQAVSLIPEQPRYRLSRARLPPRGFLVSLIYSGGTGENSEVLLISSVHLDRVRNGPTKESGRTQQLCHLWARESCWSFISVLFEHFYSYILHNLARELLKLVLTSGTQHCLPSSASLLLLPQLLRSPSTGGWFWVGSPGGREEGAVDGAEAGQAHEDGDDPGHDAQVIVPKVLDRHQA